MVKFEKKSLLVSRRFRQRAATRSDRANEWRDYALVELGPIVLLESAGARFRFLRGCGLDLEITRRDNVLNRGFSHIEHATLTSLHSARPGETQLASFDAAYLAGLVFALHLNVAELCDDGEAGSVAAVQHALRSFESGSTRIFFQHAPRQDVLCVAFMQPCIDADAARHVCSHVVDAFERTFPDVHAVKKFSPCVLLCVRTHA